MVRGCVSGETAQHQASEALLDQWHSYPSNRKARIADDPRGDPALVTMDRLFGRFIAGRLDCAIKPQQVADMRRPTPETGYPGNLKQGCNQSFICNEITRGSKCARRLWTVY